MTRVLLSRCLILIQLIMTYRAQRIFKISNVECAMDKSLVRNFSCNLKTISKYKTAVDIDIHLLKTLNNITAQIQYFKKNYANKYQPFLINVSGDVCKVMENRMSSRFLVTLKKILLKYSNLVHKCPYKGHLMIKDIEFDYKNFPLHPPLGEYKMSYMFKDSSTKDYTMKVVLQTSILEISAKKIKS